MSRLYRPDRAYPAIQALPGRRRSRLWTPPGTADPAPPPFLLTDNFTGTDGTALTSHTSDDGKTWSVTTGWTAGGAIQTNKLYGTADAVMKSSVADVANAEITASIYVASNVNHTAGVVGRIASAANTWVGGYLQCTSGSFSWNIGRFLAGGFSLYDGGTLAVQPSVASTHTLMFRMSGSQYSLFYDGSQVGTTITNSEISAAGKIGVRQTAATSSTGMHIDSISAV